jgi:hypothetical protein
VSTLLHAIIYDLHNLPLTEMSTRSRKIMLLESRARQVHSADNITAICEPIV